MQEKTIVVDVGVNPNARDAAVAALRHVGVGEKECNVKRSLLNAAVQRAGKSIGLTLHKEGDNWVITGWAAINWYLDDFTYQVISLQQALELVAKPVRVFKPIAIAISPDYLAVISKEGLQVGCTEISDQVFNEVTVAMGVRAEFLKGDK